MQATRIAVCMAVYKNEAMTHRVLAQMNAERDLVDVFICDNSGDFVPETTNAMILPQSKNLGWLKGTNVAWRAALNSQHDYQAFVLLNNDVILSKDFFSRLYAANQSVGGGITGPLYDDVCRFQRRKSYPAAAHRPLEQFTPAPFVDGTCMLIARTVVDKVGLLDEESFGRFGWGADVDYCLRASREGFTIGVTHAAYLNHIGRATANISAPNYKAQALWDYRKGMTKKYGRLWGRHLECGPIRRSLKAARCFLTSLVPYSAKG